MVNRQNDTSNTLSRLNEALNSLEGRLNVTQQRVDQGKEPSHRQVNDYAMVRARQAALGSRNMNVASGMSNQSLRQSPSRNSPITAEELRAELNKIQTEIEREMNGNFTSGFKTLRDDLNGLKSSVANSGRNNGAASSAAQLRSDIALLKEDIAQLARQDTLDELFERWSVVEREVANLPEVISSRSGLVQMIPRLENLQSTLNSLPQNNDLNAMKEQVRALAVAIERMAENAGTGAFPTGNIDTRLDEISRALAAIPTSVQARSNVDSNAFERIEARIATLAKMIEEAEIAAPSYSFDDQFLEITNRLNNLQQETSGLREETRALLPNSAIEALEARITQLSSQIGAGTEGEYSRQENVNVINELNERLNQIVEHINRASGDQQEATRSLVSSLDERMAGLAERIDANERNVADVPSLDHMAGRLEEIAEMLASGGGNQPSSSIANLETQITELTNRLSNGVSSVNEESLLAAARMAAQEAVARASGNGVSSENLNSLADDLKMLETLARDSDDRNSRTFGAIHDTLLKVVDHLSALEDTVKGTSGAQAKQRQRFEVDDTPSLEPDDMMETNIPFGQRKSEFADIDDDLAAEKTGDVNSAGSAMAAMSAQDIPGVSLGDDVPGVETQEKSKSLLKNVTRKLRRGTKTQPYPYQNEAFGDTLADDDLAVEDQVAVSDEPIEPGNSGADLNAIMRRVREERAGVTPQANGSATPVDDTDSGKSDFIAAARRAARAAAADATIAERSEKMQGTADKSPLGTKLASRRKPILMAAGAILLALLAFPLMKDFVAPSGSVQPQNVQTRVEEPAAIPALDDVMNAQENTQSAAQEAANTEAAGAEEPQIRDVTEQPNNKDDILSEGVEEAPAGAVGAPDIEAETGTQTTVSDIKFSDIPEAVGPIALREAAANGDAKALYLVGDYYFGGVAGQSGNNLEKALDWYQKSADMGYAPAQYRVGNFYEKGFGGVRDLAKAKTWYQMAATQGNAAAMHNLAVLFANGPDGTPDFASAVSWFEKAAEFGVKDSQFNLGILSAQGNGTEQNLAESYKWFALAAKAGDQDAASKRDEVGQALSPEQLEMARGAVDLWRKKELIEAANVVSIPDEWQTDAAQTAATGPALSDAEMKKAVRNIQAILNNNGYDAGPVDGIMGDKTVEAIRTFQEANGMQATGEVNQELVSKLLAIAEKQ